MPTTKAVAAADPASHPSPARASIKSSSRVMAKKLEIKRQRKKRKNEEEDAEEGTGAAGRRAAAATNTRKKRGRSKAHRDPPAREECDDGDDDGGGEDEPAMGGKRGKGFHPTKRSIVRHRKERKKADAAEKKRREREERKRGGTNRFAAKDATGNAGTAIVAGDVRPRAAPMAAARAAVEVETYWEMEKVIGRRTHRGRVEYLIRWKGCGENGNTWEPASNLCDTAMTDALRFSREENEKKKMREEDERRLFGGGGEFSSDQGRGGEVEKVASAGSSGQEKGRRRRGRPRADAGASADATNGAGLPDPMDVSLPAITAVQEKNKEEEKDEEEKELSDAELYQALDEEDESETRWDWTDKGQVNYIPVQRVDVNDPRSGEIITEARVNGVPIVLVGHRGWVGFAERWLRRRRVEEERPATMSGAVDEAKVKAEAGAKAEAEVREGEGKGEADQPRKPKSPSVVDDRGGGGDRDKDDDKVNRDQQLLDLSDLAYELDVQAMIDDIGSEDVPVLRRNYNEANPIHGVIPARKFLRACWPSEGETVGAAKGRGKTKPANGKEGEVGAAMTTATTTTTAGGNMERQRRQKKQRAGAAKGTEGGPGGDSERQKEGGGGGAEALSSHARLYLHQWQFPLSDTAGRKLCHSSRPFPNGILGEDLLKYWLDLPQCRGDSPLQYLFMGREDTVSKLHRDNGGLAISIAPVVGRKECVLVHRSDGAGCLYHLTASLEGESVDLHAHPLLSRARIWRTVVEPGEILLMPQGTYHQCRNVTPCLSYSRFHLDTVNLLPFLQSLLDGDAPELEHDEILWNCTSELIRTVDAAVDTAQGRVRAGKSTVARLDDGLIRAVDTLRSLRHIVREVARRIAVRDAVKGGARCKPERPDLLSEGTVAALASEMGEQRRCLLWRGGGCSWEALLSRPPLVPAPQWPGATLRRVEAGPEVMSFLPPCPLRGRRTAIQL